MSVVAAVNDDDVDVNNGKLWFAFALFVAVLGNGERGLVLHVLLLSFVVTKLTLALGDLSLTLFVVLPYII